MASNTSTGHSYILYSEFVIPHDSRWCLMFCLLVGSPGGWTRGPGGKKSPPLHVQIKVDELAAQSTKMIEQNELPSWNEEFVMYV